ncbi:hypothetical protein BN1708_017626, partial [Verticillium longisporum]
LDCQDGYNRSPKAG